ncbi:DUF2520 domain-containing protein [candidate division KSB1 bacterium]|nr:DUF2520 domain-containing protein [candidate division KSB1 bacterium]
MMTKKSVAIIGCGRVGSNLAFSLWKTKKYAIRALIDTQLSVAGALAGRTECPVYSVSINSIPDEPLLILIATPDDAINDVAKNLAARTDFEFSRCLVAHTSGALSSDILQPLAEKGAKIASLHPVQSFSKFEQQPTSLKNLYFGIEAAPDVAIEIDSIIKDLGGRAVHIAPEMKAFYHLACAITSNFSVTLLYIALNILQFTGIDKAIAAKILEPLVSTTLQNIAESSPEAALTGPIVRGDIETITKHLNALKSEFPEFAACYVQLAKITNKIGFDAQRITKAQSDNLVDLINQFSKSEGVFK